MVRFIFFLFLIGQIQLSLSAQCVDCRYKDDVLWIVADKAYKAFEDNSEVKQLGDLGVTFGKYKIGSISKVFPNSKNDYLLRVYKVDLEDNKALKLADELSQKHRKQIEEVIKRPEEEQIALYDPSDFMWIAHRDWLWHLTQIDAEHAWDITRGSENVDIAIMDTWFDINHPDLEDKLDPQFDPFDNTMFSSTCNRNHHGTAVASYAAGETDGGGQLSSIGFDCMIIPYQAWDGGYIERAHHASLMMGAEVLTSSAGGWRCSTLEIDAERIAVQEILDNGTIIVMPAGNGLTGTSCTPVPGQQAPFFPLSPVYDERVIVVTSTDDQDNHQYFTGGVDRTHSHYPEVDICAPGYETMGAVSTLFIDNGSCIDNPWPYFGSGTGTSFAAPIVAGVCGLMKSIHPCITPEEAQNVIRNTADPVNDANLYPGMVGAGRINAYHAVMEAGTRRFESAVLEGAQYLSAGYAVIIEDNVTIADNAEITMEARFHVEIEGDFTVNENADFIINGGGPAIVTNCP